MTTIHCQSFYRHQNCITTSDILQRALALDCITPADIHPGRLLTKYEPLSQGQYPLFQKYPKFIVDFQIRERDRIREEEKEYLRQRYNDGWEVRVMLNGLSFMGRRPSSCRDGRRYTRHRSRIGECFVDGDRRRQMRNLKDLFISQRDI